MKVQKFNARPQNRKVFKCEKTFQKSQAKSKLFAILNKLLPSNKLVKKSNYQERRTLETKLIFQ